MRENKGREKTPDRSRADFFAAMQQCRNMYVVKYACDSCSRAYALQNFAISTEGMHAFFFLVWFPLRPSLHIGGAKLLHLSRLHVCTSSIVDESKNNVNLVDQTPYQN